MKQFFILIFFSFLITSCGNNKADQPADNNNTTTVINYVWQATLNDTSGKLEMKKVEATGLDSLSPESIVAFLNTSDSSVHLDLIKISNDTIYIKIPDATFLTQQMGSTGSTMYLASVVYNLTELPGIRFINFDFEEGDHAQPGTLSRDSFNNQ